ncbi:retrovirus-related pol polyprotein from transposon TNT 1-94 [Tanacetum coccineum]
MNEALTDESWIIAVQEELNQFVANDVWELVPQPKNMTIIGTKWVFRIKLDENSVVSPNKPRLVAQDYNQQEGIDYDETYVPVARLEFIRILLAYACDLDFKLFQMDVKSAFLNGCINEEGACVFTDKWSLDKLAYGPYQTNPPSPDDIISYIRNDQEGQVTRTRYRQIIDVQDYQILTREIMSTLKPLEEIIRENVFCLGEGKTRKDCGTRRGRHSTSSSFAFDQPSFSHLNDYDDDGNDEGTSRESTLSPTRFVNSLTNNIPQVFQNPPNIDPYMEPFYTRKIKIINRQVQLRDEHHGGLRSIGKGLRNLWRNMKKK